jgi:hypothetical protein
MKGSCPILLALVALTAQPSASADSLVERRGEVYAGLPETLEFECSSNTDAAYSIFNRKFRAPKNFESFDSKRSSFEWTVPVGGGVVTVQYAHIELGKGEPMVNHAYSLPAVSEHHENPLGLYVVSLEPDADDKLGGFSVFMVLNEEYLIVRSVVPIVWDTLFDCFE